MKPSLESVTCPLQSQSFVVRQFEEKRFSAPYHFHPELELTYILRGNGKRYVGSNMSDFVPGDFVLLGPNLPHCWKTESKHGKEKSGSLVVQFQKDFLGADFFEKPELADVLRLLNRCKHGIQFTGNTALYKLKMEELKAETNSFQTMILLLQLLQNLSLSKKYKLLDKQKEAADLSPAEQHRIHTVMAYIVEHFTEEVSLSQAASLANLTTSAFCKYFKSITRKTFIDVVTDYRIDYAIQQLVHTDHSVSQVAFNSGFNDLSHFHKLFKQRMQLSPLHYRKTFLQKMK